MLEEPGVVPTTEELDALLGRTVRHSLEYKGTNLPLTFSLPTQCPRTLDKPPLVDWATGEIYPPPCKANLCPRCVRSNRWKTFRAVGASGPTALLTFTQAGDEWQIIQRKMNKTREYLVKKKYSFEWAWKIECNEGYGRHGVWRHEHHVHAYVYGENLPDQGTFGEEALKRGFGLETDLKALVEQPELAPLYLWGWKTKLSEIHPLQLRHHLWINNGRLVHPSRRFFRFEGEHMTKMEVLKAVNAAAGDNTFRIAI